jgi:hypothetical protein
MKYIILCCLLGGLVHAQDAPTKQSNSERAQEAAKELVNPNTSYASLTLRNQFFSYTGDTPGADSQDSSMSLFQPIVPFNRVDGSKIIFRPLVPEVFAILESLRQRRTQSQKSSA